jgi:hypothetical protein
MEDKAKPGTADKDLAKEKRLKKQAIERAQQQAQGWSLAPDDIGLVRVEFNVPASRLFGHGGILTADRGPSRQVAADNDTDDPVYVSDADVGPNADAVKTISPGPGHYDGID